MDSDRREGVVRLTLPGGRTVALQLTFAALDKRGHDWFIGRLKLMQKGRAGSAEARADLLEALSASAITAEEVRAAPVPAYPIAPTMTAIWAAWEIAQYGPDGRSAEAGPENPRSRRSTWWGRIFARRSRRA